MRLAWCFFSSRRRHTRYWRDWSSDVCSSDLQLTAVDRSGGTTAHSGERTLGTYGVVEGDGAVAAGNLLASPDVPAAMIGGFMAREQDDLGDRLVYALGMGLEAGGEAGPVHSAG